MFKKDNQLILGIIGSIMAIYLLCYGALYKNYKLTIDPEQTTFDDATIYFSSWNSGIPHFPKGFTVENWDNLQWLESFDLLYKRPCVKNLNELKNAFNESDEVFPHNPYPNGPKFEEKEFFYSVDYGKKTELFETWNIEWLNCNALEMRNYDQLAVNKEWIGTMHLPKTMENAKKTIEFITSRETSSYNKILSQIIDSDKNDYLITHYVIFQTNSPINQETGLREYNPFVTLVKNEYKINKKNGIITKNSETIKTVHNRDIEDGILTSLLYKIMN